MTEMRLAQRISSRHDGISMVQEDHTGTGQPLRGEQLEPNPPLCAKKIFAKNLKHQFEDLIGLRYLTCYFCEQYSTPIDFDMEVHLYEHHRKDLYTNLPLKGRGMTREVRIGFVFRIMEQRARLNKQIMTTDHYTEIERALVNTFVCGNL